MGVGLMRAYKILAGFEPVPSRGKAFIGVLKYAIRFQVLAGVLQISEEEKIIKEEARQVVIGDDDMVLIPAGEFLYGVKKNPTIIQEDFHIDIYPRHQHSI